MRNMQALLGIQKRKPMPTREPMPMIGGPIAQPGGKISPPLVASRFPIKRAAVGDTADPTTDTSGGEGKISPEEVDYSANDTCETCVNMGSSGDCTKYNFPVEPSGHCEAGYEPKGGGEEGNTEGIDAGTADTGPDTSTSPIS